MLPVKKQEATRLWIEDNKESFPNTLDGETMYYSDVGFTASMWIQQLYSDNTGVQLVAYSKLKQLYKDLQVKENWNKPLLTIEDLNK